MTLPLQRLEARLGMKRRERGHPMDGDLTDHIRN